MSYEKLKTHRGDGHEIDVAEYGDGDEFSVECTVCNEVLVSFDPPEILESQAAVDRDQGALVSLARRRIVFTRSLLDDFEILGDHTIHTFARLARKQLLAEWNEAAENEVLAVLWLDEAVTLTNQDEYVIEGVVYLPASAPPVDFVQDLYDAGGLAGAFVFPDLLVSSAPMDESECPECKSGTLDLVGDELLCRGECGGIFNPRWLDDTVQFARLLSEMGAIGLPDGDNWDALLENMDLSRPELDSLFDRAHTVFESSKETT